ncbi:unnamed protein product, partial [Prorocentrum cordatum]
AGVTAGGGQSSTPPVPPPVAESAEAPGPSGAAAPSEDPASGPTEGLSGSGGWLGEFVALWLHVLIALGQAAVVLGYSCLKNVCSWDSADILGVRFVDTRRDRGGLDAGLLYGFRRRLTVNEETAVMAAVIQVADETYLARETAGGRAAVLPAGGALRAFDFGLRGAGAGQQLVGADGGAAGGNAEGAAALVGVGPARGPGLGVAAGGAAAAQPVGAGAPGQAAAAPVAVGGPGPFAAPAAPEWVMTETTAAGDRGTVVALNGTERLGGDVGIMRTDKGWIGIRRVSLSLALYAGAEAGLGARHLGISLQSDGHRPRIQFRDAVAKFEQTPLPGWPLEGPRSAARCFVFIDRRRGGPLEHFTQFKSQYHLTNDDYGVAHYESIMRMIEFLACWDQVNLHDLVGVEVAMRQAQLYEYAYAMEVHRELEDAVRRFGEPPLDLDGPGALAELRVSQAHRGEAVAIAPVGFDNVDRISLPAATTSPQTLEHLAGDVGRKIADRLQDLLLPREQGLDRVRTEGPRRLYVDPNLRNPKLYQRVLRRLVDSNLVSFQLDCECSVGLFFVHKKNGDLRMILDGRYSSLRFAEADKVELASGGAFSQIAVDGDDPIAVAGVDIADAFYNILLPPWLQKYFGLPPVRAGDFNLSHVGEGTPAHPSQKEILRQDRCTGDTLRRVISHYTSRGLIRRELLSALSAVYSFIRVVELSSFNERWRFGRDNEKSMPPRAFDIGMWEDETEGTKTSPGFTEPHHVLKASHGLLFEEPIKVFPEPPEAKFRSVSKEVWGGVWKRVLSKPWEREEPQVILEGRALYAVRSQRWFCAVAVASSGAGCLLSTTVLTQLRVIDLALQLRLIAQPLGMPGAAALVQVTGGLPRGRGEPRTSVAVASSRRRPASASATSLAVRAHVESDRRAAGRLQRRQGYSRDIVPKPGASHSFLEQESVSAATRRDYERRAHSFYLWAEHSRLETVTEEQLDETLAIYFHEQFLEGGESTDAWKLFASLAFAGRHLGLKCSSLPRATRAARGWRKLAPPRSRLPLPWAACCLVIRQLVQAGQRVLAELTAWNAKFAAAARDSGLQPLLPLTLHQLRHGGASHELLARAHAQDEVKKRGRWATDQAVRR